LDVEDVIVGHDGAVEGVVAIGEDYYPVGIEEIGNALEVAQGSDQDQVVFAHIRCVVRGHAVDIGSGTVSLQYSEVVLAALAVDEYSGR
jgi:hypothetical protein